jgi:hypothetical protein
MIYLNLEPLILSNISIKFIPNFCAYFVILLGVTYDN